MAVTPSSLSFNYKKGDALPPSRIVNYSHFDNHTIFENVPNWLHIVDSNNTSATVSITSLVSNLSEGSHSVTINVKSQLLEEQDGILIQNPIEPSFDVGTFTVTIVITEPVVLTLTPDNVAFNYEFGGDIPSPQTVNILSENNWTITENTNWISISTSSGNGNGSFQVSVTPTGLIAGTHSADITVNDGVITKVLTVTLNVSQSNSGSDYLYVSPSFLSFGYTISGNIPPNKRVELNASANWNATTNKSWINLVTTSGGSGAGALEIGLQNVSALTVGDHNGTVTITVDSIVRTIHVNVSVYAFAQQLLQSFQNYFTDEENIIEVSSGRFDTHLSISVTSVFEGNSFENSYAIPFYKGKAQKRIGLEAKKVIGNRPFIGVGNTNLFIPYKPVMLSIGIQEKELFSETITQEINLENVRFLKGTKPLNKWISNLPKKVYLTTKGVLLFSFLSDNETANKINISGAISKEYSFTNEYNQLYTVKLSLEKENLKIGDIINVSVLDVSVQVQIKPDGIDHSFLFWENQWGCWDAFEFTGEFIESNEINQTSFSFRKNYNQKETKVLDVTEKGIYKVNTGWIYTDDEVKALGKALLSKNMYLMKDNQLIKVKSSNKSLVLSKQIIFLKSFDLKFENVLV